MIRRINIEIIGDNISEGLFKSQTPLQIEG
jgi:hypothetical protein